MKIGIGYVFGAKDDGVSRTLKDLNKGLSDTEVSADKASESGGRLRDALLGLQTLQLSDIKGQLDGIQSTAQGITGSGLDTQIDSMFASFDQGFAKSAVMAGNMGGGLKKLESQVFSTAFAMNRSADEVGANALAIQKAGLSIEAIAGKGGSLSDVQKIIEVTGLGAAEFAATFQDLNKSWGMGEKGTKDFLDRFTSVNVQLGQGGEAFAALPGIMSAVDAGFSHLDMKPEEIESTVLGITKLGAALVEGLGDDPQKAMDTATSMFTALAEEGKGFDKMVAGMPGGLGSLTNEFAQLGGGLTDSLQAMKDGAKDPAKFMSAVADTFSKLDENGSEAANAMKTRLRLSLAEIAPSFSFLATGGEKTVDIFKDIANVAPVAGQGLKEVGQAGFRSGLTLQEGVDRAKMSMEQAFGGATRKERQKFANSMIKSYGLVGQTVKNLTGEGEKFEKQFREQAEGFGLNADQADKFRSVLGPITKTMTTFSQTGAHGVFVNMFGEDSVVAGGLGVLTEGFDELFPAIEQIYGILPMLMPVLAPIGAALSSAAAAVAPFILPVLAIAAAAGVLYLAATGKLGPAIEWIKEKIEGGLIWLGTQGAKFLHQLTGWFQKMDGKEMAGKAVSFIKDTISSIFSGLSIELKSNPDVAAVGGEFWNALTGAVKAGVGFAGEFAKEFASLVAEAFQSVDWAYAASTVQDGLSKAFRTQMDGQKLIYDTFTEWFDSVNWAGIAQTMGEKFLAVRHIIAEYLQEMFGKVTESINGVDWTTLGEDVGVWIGEALINLWKLSGDMQKRFKAAAFEFVVAGFAAVTSKQFWVDTFGVIWEGLKMVFAANQAINKFITGIFLGLGKAATDAIFGAGAWDGAINKFKTKISEIKQMFSDLWASVKMGAQELFGNSINTFVEHDFGIIETILDKASGWFLALKDIAGTVLESAVGLISKVFNKFKGVGRLLTRVAETLGMGPAMVADLFATSPDSGGGTAGAAAAVIGSSNIDLIRTVAKGNAEQVVWLKKIAKALGAPAGSTRSTPAGAPAQPRSTGG